MDIESIHNNNKTSVFTPDEYIFCKNSNGDITSCGFQIESPMLAHETTRFAHNAVPLGIFYAPTDSRERYQSRYEEEEHEDEIDDDLYERLMDMANQTASHKKRALTKKLRVVGSTKKTPQRNTRNKRSKE